MNYKLSINLTFSLLIFFSISLSSEILNENSTENKDTNNADISEESIVEEQIILVEIEELIDELKSKYTITIVTHSMQQAARVSQRTAFFHLGKLIEVGDTEKIFRSPEHEQTEAYVTGRYG